MPSDAPNQDTGCTQQQHYVNELVSTEADTADKPWSSEIKEIKLDYVDETRDRISMGVTAKMRLTFLDSTYHDDVGCASVEKCTSKSRAFEECKKMAVDDALDRLMRWSKGEEVANIPKARTRSKVYSRIRRHRVIPNGVSSQKTLSKPFKSPLTRRPGNGPTSKRFRI